MHLITGFAGTDHVTSANDGVRNAQIFGSGMHVVGIGQQLRAQIINNNTVRIYDGYGCMDGRFFEIPHNDYEEVTIDNGTQAQNRIDLICVRYEKSDTTGIETSRLVVVKGTPSASEAVAPDVVEGNILEGSIVAEYPLYQVNITGLNLSSIKALFEVYNQGFAEEVKDFQRLLSDEVVARAKAVSDEATARTNAIKNCIKFKKTLNFPVMSTSYVSAGGYMDCTATESFTDDTALPFAFSAGTSTLIPQAVFIGGEWKLRLFNPSNTQVMNTGGVIKFIGL